MSEVETSQADIVEVYGFRILLDKVDSLGLRSGKRFEECEIDIVQKTVQCGWTVIDAGANIGYHTLFLSRAVGDDGTVYAFEPAPDNFAILEENIKMNGCKNVIAVNAALMDREGVVHMTMNPDNHGDHHVSMNSGEFTSKCTSLDAFLPQSAKISFVKMDIQGAEYFAVCGMKKSLSGYGAILMTEIEPPCLKRCGIKTIKYLELLKSCGYSRFMSVKHRKGKSLVRKDMDFDEMTRDVGIGCNLFCYRKNEVSP